MLGIPLNVPNTITLFRIVLIPIFIFAFFLPDFSWKHLLLTALFFVAGISDWFDGYLARALKQQSAFGAFLDPVADKLMVATAMALLVSRHPGALMALPAVVIIGREIAVSALREWMAKLGETTKVKVSYIGKVKTFTQLWAIGFLLYQQPIGHFQPMIVGYILLYVAAILTLWSMFVYLSAAWPSLTRPDQINKKET
ncbi:MAG: CDP-diacylglycerol--glycerol-3-phosphate 3-phosphatidyltransferase [Gammaproteobacteria bacterium]|jgi:CDP-diacylglycerol--glycerol-3-phosphate 3-phosphatidyltransferase